MSDRRTTIAGIFGAVGLVLVTAAGKLAPGHEALLSAGQVETLGGAIAALALAAIGYFARDKSSTSEKVPEAPTNPQLPKDNERA